MKHLLITSLLAVVPMFAGNALADGRIAHVDLNRTARRVWYASIAVAFAGQALDCVSSLGGRELNGMIGNGSNGRFNAPRGFTLKLGLAAASAGAQYWQHRAGHDHYKLWTAANGIMGGIGFEAATHNWGVK